MAPQVTQPLGPKLESGSGSSLKSGQSAAEANIDKSMPDEALRQSQVSHHQVGSSTTVGGNEEPPAGIFLQTAAYLLDVHALKVYTHTRDNRRYIVLYILVSTMPIECIYVWKITCFKVNRSCACYDVPRKHQTFHVT